MFVYSFASWYRKSFYPLQSFYHLISAFRSDNSFYPISSPYNLSLGIGWHDNSFYLVSIIHHIISASGYVGMTTVSIQCLVLCSGNSPTWFVLLIWPVRKPSLSMSLYCNRSHTMSPTCKIVLKIMVSSL